MARASLVARRAAVDSRWTARGRTFTRRRRTNISIITIYPETFRTFPKDLIVHNHTLANSPPMYAMPQCMGTSEGRGRVFAVHSLFICKVVRLRQMRQSSSFIGSAHVQDRLYWFVLIRVGKLFRSPLSRHSNVQRCYYMQIYTTNPF